MNGQRAFPLFVPPFLLFRRFGQPGLFGVFFFIYKLTGGKAAAGGHQMSYYNIFLETLQIIRFVGSGRVREDAGGLLEAGGRDERLGSERSLGNTQQYRLSLRGVVPAGGGCLVLGFETGLVDDLALEEGGSARLGYLDVGQHLADYDLNVLVIDVHALQPVDFLDGVHDVVLHFLHALDGQEVVHVHGAVGERLAHGHAVAFVDDQMLAVRYGVRLYLAGLLVLHGDLYQALGGGPEGHQAFDLGDDGGVLGPADLEELGHAGQTARDVLGLRGVAVDLGHDVALLHVLVLLDDDDGVGAGYASLPPARRPLRRCAGCAWCRGAR